MKKFILLSASAIALLGLAAYDDSATQPPPAAPAAEPAAPAPADPAATPPAPARPQLLHRPLRPEPQPLRRRNPTSPKSKFLRNSIEGRTNFLIVDQDQPAPDADHHDSHHCAQSEGKRLRGHPSSSDAAEIGGHEDPAEADLADAAVPAGAAPRCAKPNIEPRPR